MRLALVALLALAAPALAKPPPSAPLLAQLALDAEVLFPDQLGADGGRAKVSVSVAAEATDVKLELTGVDGMKVEPDNRLVVRVNALHPGQPFVFEVAFRPAAGRSALSVRGTARVGGTPASMARSYPWAPAPQGNPQPPPAAVVDVATLRRGLPEGQVVRVEAWVLESFRCPPCPPGAMCKPCLMQSAIFLGATKDHPRFPVGNPPPDVAAVGVQFPGRFEHGARYTLDVRATTRTGPTMLDGVVLQAWKDGASVPLDAPPPPPDAPGGPPPPGGTPQLPPPPPPGGTAGVALLAPMSTDVVALHRGLPDGQVVRLEAWVLEGYLCPPCPPKAQCKPCMMQSAIFLGATRDHPRFPLTSPPGDVAVVGAQSPGQFTPGLRYTLDVRATAKAGPSSVDGVVVQAWQDGRPVALDAPPPPPR